MLLLSEITYENREANKWHLRLKLTLLIPAGRGVFIAQALWARSRGHGAAGLGFGGWRGGAAKLWDRGTRATSGGVPPKPPTLSPVQGKSQQNQAVAACAAHSSLDGVKWTKPVYPGSSETNFSRNNGPFCNLLFFSVSNHHNPLFYL